MYIMMKYIASIFRLNKTKKKVKKCKTCRNKKGGYRYTKRKKIKSKK